MKQLALGILAHVDAGKTTLSEALLYLAGEIRALGRVDHQNTFLDTHALEKDRGITIFSKQAIFKTGETTFAVLVINGAGGIQSHTRTLWKLLERYNVPTFLFINKMDLSSIGKAAVLEQLKTRFSEACVDFSGERPQTDFFEELALCDEALMEEVLEEGAVQADTLRAAIAGRRLFPCYFGAALKLEGVQPFFTDLDRLTRPGKEKQAFSARVFKIAHDEQGGRLTYLKITGGRLRVKDKLAYTGRDGIRMEEKVDQIRLYSGRKFQSVPEATSGMVCAIAGLTAALPGQGLGLEADAPSPLLEPVLTYRVQLPAGTQITKALACFSQLQEEEPQLHVLWNAALQEIQVQLMGQVHMEIIKSLLSSRFSLDVSFLPGKILYKETIADPVEGVGHYEPLRHYAEVRLLLEPLPRGRGMVFSTACREDDLDRNWQRLILTHLQEKSHVGVLIGAPITDMKITLLAGRAHVKHTEGGDFRQATYRAVRQGLRSAKSILLEPWYSFRLELPNGSLGRALSDLQRMEADFSAPELIGEEAVLEGEAPAASLIDYPAQLIGYTRGQGRLSCVPCGYRPCRNQEAILEEWGYDPDRDLENPADSVFCDHGAGVVVKWNEAPARMHTESPLRHGKEKQADAGEEARLSRFQARLEEDRELMRIFERTYGPMRQTELVPFRPAKQNGGADRVAVEIHPEQMEYLLVDGYNIIFAWERMEKIARENLDAARARLIDLLCSYQGYAGMELILVFDAYKVKGNPGTVERVHNITVVYTREAETADMYIEKAAYRLSKERRVRVATSDRLEQLIILGNGAIRVSAKEFYEEVEAAERAIRSLLEKRSPGVAAIGQAAGPEQERALYESLLRREEGKQS